MPRQNVVFIKRCKPPCSIPTLSSPRRIPFLRFENLRIKEEVVNVHRQDSLLVVLPWNDIFGNNDFLERIADLSERSDFLGTLDEPVVFSFDQLVQIKISANFHRKASP